MIDSQLIFHISGKNVRFWAGCPGFQSSWERSIYSHCCYPKELFVGCKSSSQASPKKNCPLSAEGEQDPSSVFRRFLNSSVIAGPQQVHGKGFCS